MRGRYRKVVHLRFHFKAIDTCEFGISRNMFESRQTQRTYLEFLAISCIKRILSFLGSMSPIREIFFNYANRRTPNLFLPNLIRLRLSPAT